MMKLIHLDNEVLRPVLTEEHQEALRDRAVMAFTPAEAKLAMAALMVRQSHLFGMVRNLNDEIARNAELHQRFADVWTNELDAIDTRLGKERHEKKEAARLEASRVEETSHSLSNGAANPSDN